MRSSIRARITEAGRQVKSAHSQPADRSQHKHGNWLSQTKDEIYYQWRFRGRLTRDIARQYGCRRDRVEQLIQERVIAEAQKGRA